jgi:hypothetical protein
MATPADALTRLLEILDRSEIRYSIGGSVASSTHGIPRTTMDVDLVADIKPDQLGELVSLLQAEFYADAGMIRDALANGRSFNLIHYATAYKFDIFPLRQDEYSLLEFARRAFAEIRSVGPNPLECAVATAEDTILRKLEWYRAGGETSERQWSDLRGVLKVSGPRLDLAYLRHWAAHLKVDDLLDRLLAE